MKLLTEEGVRPPHYAFTYALRAQQL